MIDFGLLKFNTYCALMIVPIRLASAIMVKIGGLPIDFGRIVASATYRLAGSFG